VEHENELRNILDSLNKSCNSIYEIEKAVSKVALESNSSILFNTIQSLSSINKMLRTDISRISHLVEKGDIYEHKAGS